MCANIPIHSRKVRLPPPNQCDKLTFGAVYSPNMPARLPIFLLLRRLLQQAAIVLMFVARAIMVALLWLAFLPWATIWTWRMYFTVGDSTYVHPCYSRIAQRLRVCLLRAWWISNRPKPQPSTPVSENRTLAGHHNLSMEGAPWPISLLSHPVVASVSADIVSGQIIATVIVVAFVAVFLLREWISQNARPGVFDEAPELPEMENVEVQPLEEPDVFLHIPNPVQQQPVADIVDEPTDQQPTTVPFVRAGGDFVEGSSSQTVRATGVDNHKRLAEWDMIKADVEESMHSRRRRHSWNEPYGSPSSTLKPVTQ